MQIRVISDLHIDMISGKENFARILNSDTDIDILIIAGDIGFGIRNRFRRFIKYCSETFKQTYFVLGNHEFYSKSNQYTMADQKRRIRCVIHSYENVYLLDNDVAIVDKFAILGTTLWSNPIDDLHNEINDFNYIQLRSDQYFMPSDVRELHCQNVSWLKSKLVEYANQDVIVVSHHVPSFRLLKRPADQYSTAYASSCDDLICNNPNIKLWIFGHSHNAVDDQINQCRCLSSPVGYECEWDKNEQPQFGRTIAI